MIQQNRHEDAEYGVAPVPQSEDLVSFFFDIIRQQFLTILTVALLALIAGAFYVYLTPPTYTSRATILLDPGKTRLGNLVRDAPLDAMEAESQIQLIKSEAVGLAVIKKLNLTDDPEFDPRSLSSRWVDWLRSTAGLPVAAPAKADPTQTALAVLGARLNIYRVGGNVLEIEFRSLTPQRAAEIANAFAESYIEDQLKTRYQAAGQATSWLQGTIQELGAQSAAADEAVVQFKTKNNIVASGGMLITEQQLTALNTQLVMAREKTAETKARLDRIEEIIRTGPSSDQDIGGAVSETLNNPIIVKLRTQYLEFVNREADWSRRFGKDHLAVVNLKRQIQELRTSIGDELKRIAETYKSDYEIAKQRQMEVEKAIASAVSRSQETNQAEIELRRLESSAETYRSLYKSALERNTEIDAQQSFPGTDARLITRAGVPLEKSGPKTGVILLASTVGGILLGFALGMARMSLDRVFRTADQAEMTLQAPCLALVPLLRPDKRAKDAAPRSGPRIVQRTDSVAWQAVDRPLSRFAESLRSIKSAADMSEHSVKALGFTSSVPGEGKSMLGMAFALLAAQSGVRLILVDCDLRNPVLTRMLAPNAEFGLVDVLRGKKTLEEVLWTDPETNLTFLPGATEPRMANSSDILGSADLRGLFDELRKSYNWVVVDLPPIAPIVDVRSTAGLVDAYVFTVEWARTKIAVAEFALKKASVVRENLLGVVLNKVDFKRLGRYESYRNDYYAEKYYIPYGDDRPA